MVQPKTPQIDFLGRLSVLARFGMRFSPESRFIENLTRRKYPRFNWEVRKSGQTGIPCAAHGIACKPRNNADPCIYQMQGMIYRWEQATRL